MYGVILVHPDTVEILKAATKAPPAFEKAHCPGMFAYMSGAPVLTCEHLDKNTAEHHQNLQSAMLRISFLESLAANSVRREPKGDLCITPKHQ